MEDHVIDKCYEVAELLEKAGFEGTDVSPEIALFEYGFLYNESTGDLVYTLPDHVWDELGEEPRLAMTTVTKEDVLDRFEDEKEGILSFTGMTEAEWLDMSILMQISDVQQYCGGLFDIYQSNGLPCELDEMIEDFKKEV